MKPSLLRLLVGSLAWVMTFELEADIRSSNQRLDRAPSADPNEVVIVAGEIADVWREPLPENGRGIVVSPGKASVTFAVASVLIGDASLKGRGVAMPIESFSWPEALVPLTRGSKAILVLRDNPLSWPDLSLWTVVPTLNVEFPSARNAEGARQLIADELLRVLAAESSARRQRDVILQVAPLLKANQTEQLPQFLESEHAWLRRAALAALAHATHEPRYLSAIEADLREFFESTAPSALVTDFDAPGRWAPYPLLFTHYFFLTASWSEEEDQTRLPFLSLFRFIAANPHLDQSTRWEHGIGPLCRIGTWEDLRFLYECYQQGVPQSASERQAIIMAVSRVLKLELPSWVEPQFLEREGEQHQQITAALLRAGLLRESEISARAEAK